MKTAHKDTFVIDNLPPKDRWPDLIFEIPAVRYPEKLNAAVELLKAGPERIAIRSEKTTWTFGELDKASNQVAHVLVDDAGLVPGNRVLLRGPNSARTAICWLAVLKAGGVVVATMPMLRQVELSKVIDKAQIDLALCDSRMLEELDFAPTVTFHNGELEQEMGFKPAHFDPVETYATDPAMLAFTSGTTGKPKACIHFHRDILAMADTFSRHVLKPKTDDVFAGSPPLSFTFGLGGLLVFPFHAGAASVLNETTGIEGLAKDIERFRVTTLFTSPTAYRVLLNLAKTHDFSSLRTCVSAGETLSKATSDAWFEATGVRAIDGIGATEMIHIFISASGGDIRPGATGKPVPGYRACVLDQRGNVLPKGSTGRLAVKGPTGCRYLDDTRQKSYVERGWNVTGDIYREDEDGYFWYVSRTDDMIITGGYNVAGPEVENALLTHPAVQECAVVGAMDAARGQIVKAFVVAKDSAQAGPALAKALQEHVKAAIAPYKYPRAVEFVTALPKTRTGKIQRFKLRDGASGA